MEVEASTEEEDPCPICLMPLTDEDDLAKTRCGHRYHQNCLLDWFTCESGKDTRCPYCNQRLGKVSCFDALFGAGAGIPIDPKISADLQERTRYKHQIQQEERLYQNATRRLQEANDRYNLILPRTSGLHETYQAATDTLKTVSIRLSECSQRLEKDKDELKRAERYAQDKGHQGSSEEVQRSAQKVVALHQGFVDMELKQYREVKKSVEDAKTVLEKIRRQREKEERNREVAQCQMEVESGRVLEALKRCEVAEMIFNPT